MFLKFLAACLVLAGLLIFGGAVIVRIKSTFQDRGAFLVKQLRRYTFYQERIGRSMTEVTEQLVANEPLRAAVTPGGPADKIAPLASAMHDRLMAKDHIQPDVMIVFDAAGKQLWASKDSPFDPKTLTTIAGVEKARLGTPFQHQVQVVDKTAYQMTALPLHALDDDRVIGGMLVAVRIDRLVDEYADTTDDQATLRYRPVLLGNGVLYASALPGETADILRAMSPDKLAVVRVGEDSREVIRLKDYDYDFYAEDQPGYKNGDATTVGKIYITRSRAQVVDPASSLPWLEIGVGVVLSLAIAFLMGAWVTRPIKQMVRQSKELLAGETDLTQRITVSSRDETADLAENINQVFERVHDLATGVQSAALQVGASSAEISAASREMLNGLKDQTLKIESSSSAVTELSSSIQQVAANSAQATKVAEQSSTAIATTVQRMNQIKAAVGDAAAKMRDLGESSKRIGNIVEVIHQISEQTSMLALNASIEAAHAGDQGRGFAVVADEVSSLARRVGQSAKDISTLIDMVKDQTVAVTMSMEVGTREVDGGAVEVASTLGELGQLIAVVRDTATAVGEQAIVSDGIARNMDSVRVIASELLHGAEESVTQAGSLHRLAFALEESIAGFNLDGHPRGGKGAPPPPEPKTPRALPASRARDQA